LPIALVFAESMGNGEVVSNALKRCAGRIGGRPPMMAGCGSARGEGGGTAPIRFADFRLSRSAGTDASSWAVRGTLGGIGVTKAPRTRLSGQFDPEPFNCAERPPWQKLNDFRDVQASYGHVAHDGAAQHDFNARLAETGSRSWRWIYVHRALGGGTETYTSPQRRPALGQAINSRP
jgi:hypothetical protein